MILTVNVHKEVQFHLPGKPTKVRKNKIASPTSNTSNNTVPFRAGHILCAESPATANCPGPKDAHLEGRLRQCSHPPTNGGFLCVKMGLRDGGGGRSGGTPKLSVVRADDQ